MRRYLLLLLIAFGAPAAEPTVVGLREEARAAASRGDLDAARRVLTQAAAAQPDSTSIQLDLAAVAAQGGDA
ncbi:MAG: tetratricopeptide repeat protein, partial [Opitutaceae bacterium]